MRSDDVAQNHGEGVRIQIRREDLFRKSVEIAGIARSLSDGEDGVNVAAERVFRAHLNSNSPIHGGEKLLFDNEMMRMTAKNARRLEKSKDKFVSAVGKRLFTAAKERLEEIEEGEVRSVFFPEIRECEKRLAETAGQDRYEAADKAMSAVAARKPPKPVSLDGAKALFGAAKNAAADNAKGLMKHAMSPKNILKNMFSKKDPAQENGMRMQ